MHKDEERKIAARRDAFARIAIWQTLVFVLLICFVWANELFDLPALMFGAAATSFNLYLASVLTAAIIVAAVIAVGHTYEQQRGLLRRLLQTCMYCHRVKTREGTWEHVEEYFIKHYPVPMERGACPACSDMLVSVTEKASNSPAKALL